MKRLFTILCAAAAIAASAACNKLTQGENITTLDDNAEYADVTFNVSALDAEVTTRLDPDAAEQQKRGEANLVLNDDVQILIFDENGENLMAYKETYGGGQPFQTITASLKLNEKYRIYATGNGVYLGSSQNWNSETGLKTNVQFDITDEELFTAVQVISNPVDITVSESNMSVDIKLRPILAEIRLVSVKNNLPTSLTIKGAFLSNVATAYTIANGHSCSSSCSHWLNPSGRTTTLSDNSIITASTAGMASLTYRTVSDASIASDGSYTTTQYLYCYPNSALTEPNGDERTTSGSSIALAPTSTMLVLVTEIGGTTYYYPVNLNKRIANNKIEAGYTYDVSLTINNYGSPDEPNKEISTEAVTSELSIADFTDGGDVSYTI